MHVSERRACAALGQHRSTQRKVPRGREDAERLTADVIELARQYGRYGYRKIAALLRDAGWLVSDTRVERVWQREGLKVPQKQPKRGRLWLTNGSCIRLRPEHSNHVWSYDFVEDRTHDGRKYRMLNVIDEFTHECLAIRINRKLKAVDVIDVLSDLFILRGVPGHIRSEFQLDHSMKAGHEAIKVTPVRLPLGRLMLSTRPSATGSWPLANTTGMLVVAALAARADAAPPVAKITATRRETRSAANSGNLSSWLFAQRNSMATLWPST